MEETSRARRLKTLTGQAHDRLDAAIMAGRPFEDRSRYGRFLQIQHAFHRDIAPLYDVPELERLLPGLKARQRLSLTSLDLADLGVAETSAIGSPPFPAGRAVDAPAALGWLYVAEGSNMGAALLRKQAAKLGLSDDFGARHLAPAQEGPAAHWRAFTAALDAIPLQPDEEVRAVAGAAQAFDRVRALVRTAYG